MGVTVSTRTDNRLFPTPGGCGGWMSVPAVSVRAARPRSIERTDRMAHNSGPDSENVTAPGPETPVVIDCDDCAVRGRACRECVVSVLLGIPETLMQDERAALEVLAEVGLVPRLRLVPIRRNRGSGVA